MDPAQWLTQARQAMFSDHARLGHLIDLLHEHRAELTPAQQQQLDLLDADNAKRIGNITDAVRLYKSVLDHASDEVTAARARTSLVGLYLLQRNYIKAYTLANELMEKLPGVSDPEVRNIALRMIIRVLDDQNRYDEAIKYTHELEGRAITEGDRCVARVFRTQERIYRGDPLAALRDDYDKAIATCRKAKMPAYPDGLIETWIGQVTEDGHPDKALAQLERMAPNIIKYGTKQHAAGIYIVYAEAYLKKAEYKLARKYALMAVSANRPGTFNWTLEYAYSYLYEIAKHQGKFALALEMHERYMAQYKAVMDNAKAQAIAYQIVKQDVLTGKLKLDQLAKENRILQLRQSLARKSAETNRLYALLLLILVVSIGLWAYRTKQSQLRFRHMARHDDLTNAFNRQYFFETAEGLLRRLQKTHEHACLMILDMDHFKRINDRFGHVQGDTVLQHVASTCRGELRESDVFGRLGGEEFGILMPGCSDEQGKEVGQRICQMLNRTPVNVDGEHSVTVTASIGMACTRECGYVVTQLMIHADAALYEAKRGGRNQLIVSAGHTEPATA